jgi:hypothetical protein
MQKTLVPNFIECFRKVTKYKQVTSLFSNKFKMLLYFLVIDVLLNTWEENGLIVIYKFIFVKIVINMFAYNSRQYFPNTVDQ